MTYKEAAVEMEKMAAGRNWMLQYQGASYLGEPHIHGYIAGAGADHLGHAPSAPTYAQAIVNMRVFLIGETDAAPEDGGR